LSRADFVSLTIVKPFRMSVSLLKAAMSATDAVDSNSTL